jgi:hypothetical protein
MKITQRWCTPAVGKPPTKEKLDKGMLLEFTWSQLEQFVPETIKQPENF